MSFHKHGLMTGTALICAPERKDGSDATLMLEVKNAIAELGKTYEAFKAANDAELKELKKGISDAVTADKMKKIGDTLDQLVESKAALEKKLEAEKKEREELELRLSRPGGGGGTGGTSAADELKALNDILAAYSAETRRQITPFDAKGAADYCDGFKTWLRRGMNGPLTAEYKAMSVGSDPDGGYFVTPDTTGRMVKKVYETSDIRQIADVQAISSDALEGMEDLDEAGAGWVGETTARADTSTPQVGKWKIEAHEMYAQPKATQKLLDDSSVDIETWLAEKVGARFGRLENAAFVSGNGVAKPRGFLAYPVAADSGSGVTWGSIGYVATGVSGDFAASNKADKLYDLMGLLKNDYLSGARWVTKRAVITAIRKFKDGQGQYLWQPSLVLGQPETLIAFPVTRAEDMPAVGADSYSLAFGDFKQGYQIVDRLGVRTLRDPYTDKPYVKFYTIKRVGGGVVNFEAIKLLKFGTS